MLKVKGKRKME